MYMKKKKYYLNIDAELYERLESLSKNLSVSISDLLKLVAHIKVGFTELQEWGGNVKRVSYYAPEDSVRLTTHNANYKLLKFLKLYSDNFKKH